MKAMKFNEFGEPVARSSSVWDDAVLGRRKRDGKKWKVKATKPKLTGPRPPCDTEAVSQEKQRAIDTFMAARRTA